MARMLFDKHRLYLANCQFSSLTAKLHNWNFLPLKVVSRWRDSQLQVSKHYSELNNFEI